MDEYINDKNLSNFNRWLYGPCSNDTDTEGISYLIKQKYFTKSACIKKYFDSKDQKYYDINESKYRVPKIEHGTYNFNKSFYSIIIEDCEDDSLSLLFNENRRCKKENNTYIHIYKILLKMDLLILILLTMKFKTKIILNQLQSFLI